MGISVAVPSLLLLLLLPPAAAHFSFTYNFTAASPSDSAPSGISFQGDAFFNKYIRLTRDERVGPLTSSASRSYFSRPIALSDPITRRLASFSSSFAFSISAPEPSAASGDGLAFFLSPFPSVLPNSSAGGLLGLFNSSTRDAIIPLVAIEFDTFRNDWDPSDDHVGINLGGIVSDATTDWPTSMKDGRTAHARVAYDGDTKNLTVALSYGESPPTDVVLWFAVDLREHLPDAVAIGFSAATGEAAELHKVLYWDFTSSVDPEKGTLTLVNPGNPELSLLYRRLNPPGLQASPFSAATPNNYSGPQEPRDGSGQYVFPLSGAEDGAIRDWIKQGAFATE
jgi:hypothetical protein